MSIATRAVSAAAAVSTPRVEAGHKKHPGRTATTTTASMAMSTAHHRHGRRTVTNAKGSRRDGVVSIASDRRRPGGASTAAVAGATASPDTSSSPSSPSQSSDEDKSDRLSLDNVRASLIRQEDSIIFGLIERAQYKLNEPVYAPGGVDVPCFKPDGTRASMLEFMLRENEQVGGKIRRYTSPDEHAYYPNDLPLLVIGAMSYPNPLAPCADAININDRIMDMYVNDLLPALCEPGNDNNYGSTGLADVNCLQTISKRIHYGKFVAESKFQARPEEFTALIKAQDAKGLMQLLTFKAVEDRVVRRVTNKAATYGQDISEELPEAVADLSEGRDIEYKVEPERVGELYEKWIMPMTKDVQV